MAGRSWLESSLDRSSKLGLEVLERARRRSVDWKSPRSSHSRSRSKEKPSEIQEDPGVHVSLDRAFAKLVECMSEATNQCTSFYGTARAAELSVRERHHVCSFHSSGRCSSTSMASKRAQNSGLSEPEDFLIEVPPGTYAITAAMRDAGPQTQVVQVNAGESTRLTFSL